MTLQSLPDDLALEERIRFETLLADLAAEFVYLPASDVDRAVTDALRRLVTALGIERSSLLELNADGDLTTTHFWAHPDFQAAAVGTSLRSQFPWAFGRLLADEPIVLDSIETAPEPDRSSARAIGLKSNVTIPLRDGGRVVGALAFGSLRQQRVWPPELVARFRLIAQVFASALARRRGEIALRDALDEVRRLRDQLRQENEYLRQAIEDQQGSSLIVGRSPAITAALAQARQVAATGATVLLLGETGTGKELFATEIHDQSPRHARVMVRVNCAAIPAALIESELFGREKGAYTGALTRHAGRFEVAHGSSLFLDEIGDLPIEAQIKLLRVLQERQIERLGSSTPIKVDVRIIAATHRDLEQAVAKGTFREDLYYRLNVFPIRIPPLRERQEDIPLLVWRFVEEFSRAFNKTIEAVSKDSMLALQRHHWPGNIRELRNVVERAVIVATTPRLTIELSRPSAANAPSSIALVDIERDHIRAILARASWRVRGADGAARLLGMKPTTLESRMKKLGIRRPSV